jgi:GTP-binding protein EngB required for normal cell division
MSGKFAQLNKAVCLLKLRGGCDVMPEDSANSLNSNHERRLAVTCRHIDKLLADMESALNVSASKLAFPQYAPDLTSAQKRVIEDYISRIRAQLVRVLDGQNMERPPADIPVSRTLHVTLTFVDIAVEELKPEYMRGYGEVHPATAIELNGIAGELQGLVRQLDHYLTRGAGENLQQRLEKLEETGDEVLLLKKLESIITERGLVEFRATLSMILDRLEDNRFEIAIFGRVSSGKSSLLNAMLETDVLPVGATPITAVPTRLAYGEAAAINVWFANRLPERYEISRLPEFVSEHLNPGNEKHVTRIVVQLPSRRLRNGISFVDTPGLGSLATRGAAETLAYLPRCDLGVVLIDAGSTLTPDDLQTIQILYDAAIPAMVLLSKADLLTVQDRSRVIEYVKNHIRKELNLDLTVHAVSVVQENKELLAHWFEDDIAPLYNHCQELKVRSIRRKLGGLRQSVEIALRGRLRHKDQISLKAIEQLRMVEGELRQASGRLEEMKKIARQVAKELATSSRKTLRIAGASLVESWSFPGSDERLSSEIVSDAVIRAVQEQTEALRRRMDGLAHKLHETLQSAAKVLEIADVPAAEEFASVLREMPAYDLGRIAFTLRRPALARLLGRGFSESLVTKRLNGLIGDPLTRSLSAYHALLYDWSERTLGQIQRRFDAYANSYRAQVERSLGSQEPGPAQDEGMIRRDLEVLESTPAEKPSLPESRARTVNDYEEERNRATC